MKLFSKLKQNPNELITQKEGIFILIISAILILCPLLYKLNQEPLKRWDESLYAMVAYDLAYHGRSLQAWSDFQGQNYLEPVTKPKTLFWMQAGLMKILGYDSKLAIRLPSVSASILLIVFLIYFCYREFNSLLLGIFSSFVLVTIRAYMFHHIARSGDFDAFLLLFSTMALLFYYKFINQGLIAKEYRYLFLTCASIGGAVVFKNIAGLFMLPSILIYTIYKRKIFDIIKLKQFYLAIGIFLLIITPYYIFEAITFPNFFHELWNHEIGGRYGGVIDYNQHPFPYYFNYLFATYNHAPWVLFIPLTIILVWGVNDERYKDFLVFSLIIIFSFLLLISVAQTKIAHYVAPTYPLIALIVGISLYFIFSSTLRTIKKSSFIYRMLLLSFFGIAIIFPSYLNIFQSINAYKEYPNDCGFHYDVYEECFKKIYKENLDYKDLVVFRDSSDWWIPQLLFYKNIYTDIYHFNIRISEKPQELKENQNIVICYRHMSDIQDLYKYDVLMKFNEIQVIKLKEKIN
jgi:4-amino-4-deoxy-L-arabinose transferase-like glycosyltransferase